VAKYHGVTRQNRKMWFYPARQIMNQKRKWCIFFFFGKEGGAATRSEGENRVRKGSLVKKKEL